MTEETIVPYLKDPSLLGELCRDVIEQLDSRSENGAVAEQDAQLRVITKAVEQLEKLGVAVPEPLRAEKTRLVAALAVHADAKQALEQLADEFQEIVKDLRDRLGQTTPPPPETKKGAKRPRLPKTSKQVLRKHIVQALRTLGGRARVADVIAEMGRQLEGALLPGDTVWRESTKEPAWQNNAKWERFVMVQDGVLKQDSPHGVWELEETR